MKKLIMVFLFLVVVFLIVPEARCGTVSKVGDSCSQDSDCQRGGANLHCCPGQDGSSCQVCCNNSHCTSPQVCVNFQCTSPPSGGGGSSKTLGN